MHHPLLEISGLRTVFDTDDGQVRAVDDVSFTIEGGRTLGVVGESGCGKSVTGLSILQLVPSPGQIEAGHIRYHKNGQSVEITELSPKSDQMRAIRGNDIAMIFQEPMTSLNPVYTVGNQVGEAIRLHQQVGKKEARNRAIEMLIKVGIPAPEQRIDEYPHQLSGGMRQRVMIAMALSCNPSLLIADEPTTALDVTIQAQVLDLMKSLQEELRMAIMLITHDLGVIADIADEVVVMYAGKVVERGSLDQIFDRPLHPYTKGLLASIPELGADRQKKLYSIPGTVPSPLAMPSGCAFAPRCQEAFSSCQELPPLELIEGDHATRCWLHLLTEKV
ncbi:MAG: dipeptide/oligopeptide/nickel ABC transporter ATP-binding protein [Planctomycetes bacterium]|nr:dipeptide/oligopeptide/nickel ABC transporter ATP-binding protein [Planctomycetota bacterium]